MIDVHSFKVINDNFGHAEGDRCLREVGQAIAGAVREPDLCFRWGGDEFSLILTGTTANEAAPLGARLKGAVYKGCSRPDGHAMEITFAVAELGDDMPASELGAMAGMALTSAKAADKDTEREDANDFGDRF
jgi:diguanylate cyclase (GGDEF)-like protein